MKNTLERHAHVWNARRALARHLRSRAVSNDWLLHTHCAGSEVEARKDFEEMRTGLAQIADKLLKDPVKDEAVQQKAMKAIANFVDRFPT
jgi:hypothetical protein